MSHTPSHRLIAIYLSNLLLSFHFFLIIYVNSSYLGTFFSADTLGLLYMVGSVITTILLFCTPRILSRIGNHKYTLWALVLEASALVGLAVGSTPMTVALAFITHQAIIPLATFGLDVFLEGSLKNEKHTGVARGLYLTLGNITLVVSPLLTGILLASGHYGNVYLVSLLFLFPLFFVVRHYLRGATGSRVRTIDIRGTLRDAWSNRDIRGALAGQCVLQFFYAWMVIYMPLYLHNHIGFSWSHIGVIFTIMLLPFMLFELPLGALADKKIGEKEILITGFCIMSVTTFCIPALRSSDLVLWALFLFLTRVGASFVEVSSESYFFKHVTDKNAGFISLFRATRPLSYIITPAVVSLAAYCTTISHAPYSYTFSILGIITLTGALWSFSLKDTK